MERVITSALQRLTTLRSINTLSSGIRATAIVIATTVLYFQDLSMVFADATLDESSIHLLLIPVLFAYLVYRKRKLLRAVIPLNHNQSAQRKYLTNLNGILLCMTAMILYWYGSYTFTPLEYHILTLPLFAAGLILVLFNYQTLRQLAFPIIFLAFLTPPPIEILYGLGSTLSVISSDAANALVNAVGIPSVISGEYGNPTMIVTRPDKTVIGFTIDIACSGIYSLVGFFICAAFIAYIQRDRPWKKAAVLALGFPLIMLLNIMRIAIISLIGYYCGEQLALQVFHIAGGWILLFLGTLLVLLIAEKMFKKPQRLQPCQTCSSGIPESSESCPDCGRLLKYQRITIRKTDMIKIATIAIALTFLLYIQAPVFALTQGPAKVIIQTPAGEQGNTQILPQIQDYNLTFVYRDTNFEHLAKQDASLVYAYVGSWKEPIYVTVEVASARAVLHRWETCLITWPQTHGYQPKVTQLDLRDIQIMQNPPIIARYFTFQYTRTNETQIVLYWYETATFTANNTVQRRHVKISLILYSRNVENVTASENQLLPFAVAIADFWQPTKIWTEIALIISTNGLTLSAATMTLLTIAVVYQTYSGWRERESTEKLYEKLHPKDKLLIQAVGTTSGTIGSTIRNIAVQLVKLGDGSETATALVENLEKAERAGLVKKEIVSQRDQPAILWKSQAMPMGRLFR